METINILFLGGAKRISLAQRFISAGLKLKIDVKIFSYELNKEVPIYSTAKIIIGKLWNDDKILSHLLETIYTNKINILLPCVDPAIILASQLKKMTNECFIPVSEPTICNIMYDKCESYNYFKALNIDLPPTECIFPMIAKPRKGSASVGIKILEDENEYNNFKYKYDEKDFLVQQYLNAFEYTVDAFISKEGKFIGAVPRLRLEVFAGEVIKSVTIKDFDLIKISHFILSQQGFGGPITIQYLKEKLSGINYLMEINPRLGGGVINSIEGGFDIPLFIIKEYLGLEINTFDSWKENLMMTRSFQEVFFADYYRP
jgi:carbamoyl-phosphate synthase large subunit